MANEIQVTAQIQIAKGTLSIPKTGPSSLQVTMTGDTAGVPGIMLASTGANGPTVTTVGVTTLGWALLRNIHATAIVTVGVIVAATFHSFAKMKPGEPALIRLVPGVTYAVKSDVNDSPVHIIVASD